MEERVFQRIDISGGTPREVLERWISSHPRHGYERRVTKIEERSSVILKPPYQGRGHRRKDDVAALVEGRAPNARSLSLAPRGIEIRPVVATRHPVFYLSQQALHRTQTVSPEGSQFHHVATMPRQGLRRTVGHSASCPPVMHGLGADKPDA